MNFDVHVREQSSGYIIFHTPKPLVFIREEGRDWKVYVISIDWWRDRRIAKYYVNCYASYQEARENYKQELDYLLQFSKYFRNWPCK